jgi:hypothetical protein
MESMAIAGGCLCRCLFEPRNSGQRGDTMMEVDDKFECNARVEIFYILIRSIICRPRSGHAPMPHRCKHACD